MKSTSMAGHFIRATLLSAALLAGAGEAAAGDACGPGKKKCPEKDGQCGGGGGGGSCEPEVPIPEIPKVDCEATPGAEGCEPVETSPEGCVPECKASCEGECASSCGPEMADAGHCAPCAKACEATCARQCVCALGCDAYCEEHCEGASDEPECTKTCIRSCIQSDPCDGSATPSSDPGGAQELPREPDGGGSKLTLDPRLFDGVKLPAGSGRDVPKSAEAGACSAAPAGTALGGGALVTALAGLALALRRRRDPR